jgi:hypothetical protein
MNKRIGGMTLVLCLTMMATSAWAVTIFDTFGPGDTHSASFYTVGAVVFHAGGFMPVGGDFTLTQVDLPLWHQPGLGPNAAVVELRRDAANHPGTVLESWTVTGLSES